MIKYREMTESDNAAVATLVRDNLKQFNLDIPGTVYFDAGLDHLYDYYGDVRSVDVTIRRIREKIEDNTSEPKYIITKRGIGYYV